MRLDLLGEVFWVRLSRRNLQALLIKLDKPSARTLVSGYVFDVSGDLADRFELVVTAEDDETHYRDRPEPPGEMADWTEEALRQLRSMDDQT